MIICNGDSGHDEDCEHHQRHTRFPYHDRNISHLITPLFIKIICLGRNNLRSSSCPPENLVVWLQPDGQTTFAGCTLRHNVGTPCKDARSEAADGMRPLGPWPFYRRRLAGVRKTHARRWWKLLIRQRDTLNPRQVLTLPLQLPALLRIPSELFWAQSQARVVVRPARAGATAAPKRNPRGIASAEERPGRRVAKFEERKLVRQLKTSREWLYSADSRVPMFIFSMCLKTGLDP